MTIQLHGSQTPMNDIQLHSAITNLCVYLSAHTNTKLQSLHHKPVTMPAASNQSCCPVGGYDTHHNRAMLVLGVWQAVIAALIFLVTIAFGILNRRHMGKPCAWHPCLAHMLTSSKGHERG